MPAAMDMIRGASGGSVSDWGAGTGARRYSSVLLQIQWIPLLRNKFFSRKGAKRSGLREMGSQGRGVGREKIEDFCPSTF